MTFAQLLKRAGMTKAELASELGLSRSTMYHWGDNAPEYAMAYLRQRIELNRYRP